MSELAVQAHGISKQYRIGSNQESYRTLRDLVSGAFATPFRSAGRLLRGEAARRADTNETIWALKDVSFEIRHGEAMGIIGRNGAGKSTLLKILSRITEPTEGYADIEGRVGSLLEVGTGFHPELSGRENIFLNGAILGMRQGETKRKLNEIVDFAEIEKFIDTPVKHYSSGMYMRLAFAVAAHLEPEILMVDEVLAVGDAAFQKKCLGKMKDVTTEGRTILFVSHNIAAIKSLCQSAMLLEGGRQVIVGPAFEVVQRYLQGSATIASERAWADLEQAPGNEKARLQAVRILDLDGQPASQVNIEDPLVVEVEYAVLAPDTVLNVSISLFTQEDVHVFASASTTDAAWYQRPHPAGLYRSRCEVPGRLLNSGRYSVTVLLVEQGARAIAQVDQAVSVEMVDLGATRGGFFGYWGGVVRPLLNWETECLQPL